MNHQTQFQIAQKVVRTKDYANYVNVGRVGIILKIDDNKRRARVQWYNQDVRYADFNKSWINISALKLA